MSDEEDNAPAEITDPVKILEGLLRRFQLLNGTVSAFHRDVANMQPLPPYPVLMTRLNAMRDSANELTAELNNHKDLFNARVLTPAPQFAARYHIEFLGNLFRTKMEPNVEDWEQQHLKIAKEKEDRQTREKTDGKLTTLSERDQRDLWNWAPLAAQQEAMNHVWFQADYTIAEKEAGIENVKHGLRRTLVVPELPDFDEDEEEDEFEDVEGEDSAAAQGEKMDVDIARPNSQPSAPTPAPIAEDATKSMHPPIPIDNILRFMTKGEKP